MAVFVYNPRTRSPLDRAFCMGRVSVLRDPRGPSHAFSLSHGAPLPPTPPNATPALPAAGGAPRTPSQVPSVAPNPLPGVTGGWPPPAARPRPAGAPLPRGSPPVRPHHPPRPCPRPSLRTLTRPPDPLKGDPYSGAHTEFLNQICFRATETRIFRKRERGKVGKKILGIHTGGQEPAANRQGKVYGRQDATAYFRRCSEGVACLQPTTWPRRGVFSPPDVFGRDHRTNASTHWGKTMRW